jgi:hypothetical protein
MITTVERGIKQVAGRLLDSQIVRDQLDRRVVDRPRVFDDACLGIDARYEFGHTGRLSFTELSSLSPTPEGLIDRPELVEPPPWTVFECPDAQLVGPEGLTFLSSGQVLLENSLGWNKRVGVSGARTLLNRTFPFRRDSGATQSFETAVSLVGPWTDNYYHWHLDYLCRLAALSSYIEATGRHPPLLLPPNTTEWMRATLSLVGYDKDEWITWDGRRTAVDQLIVPALPRETEGSAPTISNHYYSLNSSAVRWLGERMLSNADDITSHTPDSGRLYVSRQGGDTRRVNNLDELSPTLEAYGFERFRPEDYSVAEQVRAFADADVVLGVHGAGLTNLLFARDATLVEMFGSYVNPVFYALAIQTGNEYACAQFEARRRGLTIDPDRLRDLLALASVTPL